jgi:hypothetical protein
MTLLEIRGSAYPQNTQITQISWKEARSINLRDLRIELGWLRRC